MGLPRTALSQQSLIGPDHLQLRKTHGAMTPGLSHQETHGLQRELCTAERTNPLEDRTIQTEWSYFGVVFTILSISVEAAVEVLHNTGMQPVRN